MLSTLTAEQQTAVTGNQMALSVDMVDSVIQGQAVTVSLPDDTAETSEQVFERQVAKLRRAQSVYSVPFKEYVRGLDKDGEAYKQRRSEWNNAKRTVSILGKLAVSDVKPRLVCKMNGPHRFIESAKVIPGSVADAAMEGERLAKLDAAVPFFTEGSTMQSYETGLTVKELAAIAKQQKRVPYRAYEQGEDGEYRLTLKAAIAWVESQDMARVAKLREINAEITQQMTQGE